MPKFSIVIPCFNVAPYLRECLDSVLTQVFTVWEAICVDDGSTDGTAAILDEYEARDTRFRVIHKKNAGVCVARNDAIAVAAGEYVCFLDGDDVWSPSWLQRMAEATLDGRADIVRMQFTFWHRGDKGEPMPKCEDVSELTSHDGNDEVLSWGWQTYTTDGYICLNAVRRELLIKNCVTFPVGMKINEDIIFDLSVLPFSKCAVQCSYAGYFYRMRSTSAWHSKRPIEGCTRYLEESIKLWTESRTTLGSLDCLQQLRLNEAYMFYCAVLQWLDFGLKEERRRAKEIAKLLKKANSLGMLNLRSLPVCWRPAFFACVTSGSFSLIRLTYSMLEVYHRIHKWLLRI